ncbi:MAG: sugar phosphate isomerase/epimerase family protein [Armatimonadota bacterium]
MKWGIAAAGRFGEDIVHAFAIASEIVFYGLEIPFSRQDYESELIWSAEGVRRLLRLSGRYGLEMSSCIAGRYNLRGSPDEDPAVRQEAAELLLGLIDRCADAGIGRILVAFFGRQQMATEEQIERTVAGVSRCAARAESRGVTLALQGTVTAPQWLEILARIGSEAVGVYYDVGNAIWLGYDGPAELQRLAEAGVLAQIHVKDMTLDKQNVPPGEGDVDWDAVGVAVRTIGWDDYLVLETPVSAAPREDYSTWLELLRGRIEG